LIRAAGGPRGGRAVAGEADGRDRLSGRTTQLEDVSFLGRRAHCHRLKTAARTNNRSAKETITTYCETCHSPLMQ
jgi:hypothetical protein